MIRLHFLLHVLFACLLLAVAAVPAYAAWTDDPAKMEGVFNIAAQVCLVASLLANFTPTESDNKVIAWIRRFVDLAAANWWNVFKKKG